LKSLLWLRTGACVGAHFPSLEQLLSQHGVELLWRPSLSHAPMRLYDALLERNLDGSQQRDILCVEGSIVTAPRGTGLYDSYPGRARMEIARDLAWQAGVVVAMGTCSAASMPRPRARATASVCNMTAQTPAACFHRSGAHARDIPHKAQERNPIKLHRSRTQSNSSIRSA
jgi:Ni,Fe-hydrogenase I small subunit